MPHRQRVIGIDAGIAHDLCNLQVAERGSLLPMKRQRVDQENGVDRRACDGRAQCVICTGAQARESDVADSAPQAQELDSNANVVERTWRIDLILCLSW